MTNTVEGDAVAGDPASAQRAENDVLSSDLLQQIDDRVPDGYNWSDGYNENLQDALNKYKTEYYKDITDTTLSGSSSESLKFFNEELFRPENAHPDEQKFIIFQHLLFHYRRQQWQDLGEIEEHTPPCENLFVEGLADAGKTFVIQVNRNATITIEGRNSANMASAPSGCAARIISGMANCCSCNIPTGAALKAKPSPTTLKTVNQVLMMRHSMSLVVYRTLDKHSMCGRPVWGWLEQRHSD